MYKTTKYEYSTSAGGNGQNNSYTDRGNINEINKLDTLLNDLENERTATLERCKKFLFEIEMYIKVRGSFINDVGLQLMIF